MRGVKRQYLLLATVLFVAIGYPGVQAIKPKVLEVPKSFTVVETSEMTLFCKVSGNPVPTIEWQFNGEPINLSADRAEVAQKNSPLESSLHIKNVNVQRDSGTYSCMASSNLGRDTGSGNIVVIKKEDVPRGFPKITDNPTLKPTEKDRTIKLRCGHSGEPEPKIFWIKDYEKLDTNNDPRISVLPDGALEIKNCQEGDEATYSCVVYNDKGYAFSYGAMVYIKVRRIAPKFYEPQANVVVAPGQDLNLTCVAHGSPRPQVIWSDDERMLTKEDEIPVGKNILELKDVRRTKNYTCTASSALGNIEHVVQVIVNEEPTRKRPESFRDYLLVDYNNKRQGTRSGDGASNNPTSGLIHSELRLYLKGTVASRPTFDSFNRDIDISSEDAVAEQPEHTESAKSNTSETTQFDISSENAVAEQSEHTESAKSNTSETTQIDISSKDDVAEQPEHTESTNSNASETTQTKHHKMERNFRAHPPFTQSLELELQYQNERRRSEDESNDDGFAFLKSLMLYLKMQRKLQYLNERKSADENNNDFGFLKSLMPNSKMVRKLQYPNERRSSDEIDDDDFSFLKSLMPYFRMMPLHQKLQARNELQSVFLKYTSPADSVEQHEPRRFTAQNKMPTQGFASSQERN